MALKLSAIGSLMTEHRLIERVIQDMQRRLERFDEEASLDPSYVYTAVDFLRTYADRCHHGKEEDILFRELEGRPLTSEHAQMMHALVTDHVWARAKTKALIEATDRFAAGDDEAAAQAREFMRALADFYPEHIQREDHGFFKPAIEYFTPEQRDQMADKFYEFDRRLIHEKYERLAEELESRTGSSAS